MLARCSLSFTTRASKKREKEREERGGRGERGACSFHLAPLFRRRIVWCFLSWKRSNDLGPALMLLLLLFLPKLLLLLLLGDQAMTGAWNGSRGRMREEIYRGLSRFVRSYFQSGAIIIEVVLTYRQSHSDNFQLVPALRPNASVYPGIQQFATPQCLFVLPLFPPTLKKK